MNQHMALPFRQLRTLFRDAGGAEHRIPAGETVFTNDEHNDIIFLLLRGRVKLYLMGSAARQVLVGLVRPGELLGEAALLEHGRRLQMAVALEDAVVLGLPATTFVRLLYEHGVLATA
ncbi:MAG: cyclic nucleotide-binding domain-containing protein, partial [Dehalococcoidia bacterium]